jgi:hypothetical protein
MFGRNFGFTFLRRRASFIYFALWLFESRFQEKKKKKFSNLASSQDGSKIDEPWTDGVAQIFRFNLQDGISILLIHITVNRRFTFSDDSIHLNVSRI